MHDQNHFVALAQSENEGGIFQNANLDSKKSAANLHPELRSNVQLNTNSETKVVREKRDNRVASKRPYFLEMVLVLALVPVSPSPMKTF